MNRLLLLTHHQEVNQMNKSTSLFLSLVSIFQSFIIYLRFFSASSPTPSSNTVSSVLADDNSECESAMNDSDMCTHTATNYMESLNTGLPTVPLHFPHSNSMRDVLPKKSVYDILTHEQDLDKPATSASLFSDICYPSPSYSSIPSIKPFTAEKLKVQIQQAPPSQLSDTQFKCYNDDDFQVKQIVFHFKYNFYRFNYLFLLS